VSAAASAVSSPISSSGSGDFVVGTVRDTGKVTDLLARYPESFHAEVLDVTDAAAIREFVERSFARLGRIDVIVSNAGYGLFGAAEELTDKQVEHWPGAFAGDAASFFGSGSATRLADDQVALEGHMTDGHARVGDPVHHGGKGSRADVVAGLPERG
jgi:NAD(P)-dependent dehydrogenase (short-subunit alcohol dehydrogenase family)